MFLFRCTATCMCMYTPVSMINNTIQYTMPFKHQIKMSHVYVYDRVSTLT